ncbi:hypothetical protein HRbin23_00804 [bacterium HR23]|nr:hypothetical protein HRbin23_00804 [bacterium HR23]
MARRAPPLSLSVPLGPVVAGQLIPCTVHLALSRGVQARALRVEVVGRLRWVIGAWGQGPVRWHRWAEERVVHTQQVLPLERSLGPGTASFRLEVPLPPDAPPSARGRMVDMAYLLRATLDISHAPDRWETVPLRVVASTPVPEPGPLTPSPEGVRVHMEAPRRVRPGQHLEGVLVLTASHPLVLSDLRLELVRWERVPLGRMAFPTCRLGLPALSLPAYEERRVPFTLWVPADAPPTCALPHGCAIEWTLRLEAGRYPPLAQGPIVVEAS